jgi:two-component system, NarL family, sensor kinase
MRTRMAARLAWSVWPFSLLLVALMVGLRVLSGRGSLHVGENLAIVLLFAVPGALIARRRPTNPIGWLLCAIGITQGLSGLGGAYGDYVLSTSPGSLPGVVGLLVNDLLHWAILGLVPLVILLFPDGRLPSRRWRPIAWLIWGAMGLVTLLGSIYPGPIGGSQAAGVPQNPLGIESLRGVIDWVGPASYLLLQLLMVASWVALVLRLRRARWTERQQLKWLAYATFFLAVAQIGLFMTSLPAWIALVAYGLFTVGIAIAILRHRLLDIDVVINRTLVYVTLSVLVVGLYIASVSLLGAVFRQRTTLEVSLLATAVVAVLFQPIRDRLQQAVNRLLYGDRQDPYAVLARLGQQLEATTAADSVLPRAAETIADALRLQYVAVEVDRAGELQRVASWGREVEGALVLPLVYHGEQLGRLVLGPRAPGEEFSPADRRLLADLARQVGVAAHSVRLTADLQRSREQLVSAREEERRRLRRDLHDGLGPTLAGVAFGIQAARNLLGRDPSGADALLDQALVDTHASVTDIRRLVYDLRPPALDELGLVSALRERAAHFQAPTTEQPSAAGELQVRVEAPEALPSLPAAVEVASYRIALEGVTNVARHAAATTCAVRITVNHGLEVEVVDDGRGLRAGWRPGVGLTSMRERAGELGGSCVLEPGPSGGTRLRAHLPLPEA